MTDFVTTTSVRFLIDENRKTTDVGSISHWLFSFRCNRCSSYKRGKSSRLGTRQKQKVVLQTLLPRSHTIFTKE